MRKLALIVLFIFPFLVGCSISEEQKKEEFMKICKLGGDTPQFIEYCECCYMQLLKYDDVGPDYMNAITDNCMR